MSRPGGYELLDHRADVGVRAFGATVEDAFAQAARGMFAVMIAVDAVRPKETHRIEMCAPSCEQLLVDWLSDLLVQKDLSGLIFGRFELTIGERADGVRLVGEARGERLDRHRHVPRVEVKGISYLGLSVSNEDGAWVARCVLDV